MVYWMCQQASHMIIVRIETDIAPHARPAAFIVQGCRDFFFFVVNADAGWYNKKI